MSPSKGCGKCQEMNVINKSHLIASKVPKIRQLKCSRNDHPRFNALKQKDTITNDLEVLLLEL